jgi:hypothetical protein
MDKEETWEEKVRPTINRWKESKKKCAKRLEEEKRVREEFFANRLKLLITKIVEVLNEVTRPTPFRPWYSQGKEMPKQVYEYFAIVDPENRNFPAAQVKFFRTGLRLKLYSVQAKSLSEQELLAMTDEQILKVVREDLQKQVIRYIQELTKL